MKMWTKLLLILLAFDYSLGDSTSMPCRAASPYGEPECIVCVCDSKYCDSLDVPDLNERNGFVFVTTSKSGDRFNFTLGQFPRRKRYSSAPLPYNPSRTHVRIKDVASGRKFRGMGATYTGSAAYEINLLELNLQHHVYNSYYSPRIGASFNIVRVPIGSTANDFRPWTYNEYPPNDRYLTNFTAFNREDRLRSCQLKQLQRVSMNPNIEFMAVSSCAPQWMTKTVTGLHGDRNVMRSEHYQTWADYHLKYLQMMDDQSNIRFSSISTGQRPDQSFTEKWNEPLSWEAYEMGKWVGTNLGPTMKTSKYSSISIIGYDDGRQSIPGYLTSMNVGNMNASRYIDAIGIQSSSKNKYYSSSTLDMTYATFPNKPILNTEYGVTNVQFGSWANAEALALEIIDNFQHDSLGFIINNLILDSNGGPNMSGQKQDAPLILSPDGSEFYKQPTYYVLAHFAKYITPGSIRLDTHTDKYLDVFTVAYLRPDNTICTIMYNKLDTTVPVVFTDMFQGTTEFNLKPKSINTLVY